jgi:LytR cell envelope-related transcriptional attenuator
MEHAHDLVRPWRRATIAVTAVAAAELIALAAITMVVLGNPLAQHFQESAGSAATPPKRADQPVPTKKPVLARNETSVMVLNGNGRAGAAHSAADRVSARGYLLGNVGNAESTTPRSIVMYRPGYAAEGVRLGRDMHVRLVRPLDGMQPAQLLGAHLVLIIGT